MKKDEILQKTKNASQRMADQQLRERCVELAIRASSYGRSAVAQLVAESKKKDVPVTVEAKRIFTFIKTGK